MDRLIGDRMEALVYQDGPPTRIGELELQRTPQGSVRVGPITPPDDAARTRREDLLVESDIRAAITTDPLLARWRLDVDVDRGLVKISGDLPDRERAARAVNLALSVDGVRGVESRTTWVSEHDRRLVMSAHESAARARAPTRARRE
jgi:hypothetical protein